MRELCREYDILFVADEVITGFGRTGPLFACEEEDIVPDFMTTAKGLTSGYVPMGAVFMADHVYDIIADGAGASAVGHGYTYSAHPVSAAVALEVLELYEDGLLENGRKAGARLMAGFESLSDHPLVGDVRGRGMLAAIELVVDKQKKTPLPASADAGAAHLRPGMGQRPDHPCLCAWRARLCAAALLHRRRNRRDHRAHARDARPDAGRSRCPRRDGG